MTLAVEWSVPDGRGPVERVTHDIDLGPVGARPRLFSHGYQSWSATRVARFGIDTDPSTAPGSIGLVRAMHHADPAVAAPGELRSEQVTVLDRGDGSPLVCLGAASGATHATTFRTRVDGGRLRVTVEAYLGGATGWGGRALSPVHRWEGDDAGVLLDEWAALAGATDGARVDAPYQVGWCSWYHYFHDVTEDALRANLAVAAGDGWPFSVFQLDDGYQAGIGDWLATNERFPSDAGALAAAIAAGGFTPGIWIAPFLAAPSSEIACAHPEWLARRRSGDDPAVGMVNPGWGGAVFALDTTRDDVIEHLEHVAGALVAAGFPYLKLDFTYAAGLPGRFADPSFTPAERVRRGLDAIRRGAGDDAFLLGCGCPLGVGVGVVDGMRIGPDVAPLWSPADGPPGYAETVPATENAWRNTLTRSFLHRRLWLNDPDCLMLRTAQTGLAPAAVDAWASAVAVSGGMALVSDDLSLLDATARARLDDVMAIGRAVDGAARAGASVRCADLMDAPLPAHLDAAGYSLVADPSLPTATVQRTPR